MIRGEPYQPGTYITLNSMVTIIGRTSSAYSPDVAFTNSFISRQHAVIRKEGKKAVLTDLGSRHGTMINGAKVVPQTPYVLETGDRIELAKGLTIVHFSYMFGEQTLELEPITMAHRLSQPADMPPVDWEKRVCEVDGRRIPMSEKEYLLLQLLSSHLDHMVPLRQIHQTVWYDRTPGPDGTPDVAADELNALIYRIRKKYGRDTFPIQAVRGSGYILERVKAVEQR